MAKILGRLIGLIFNIIMIPIILILAIPMGILKARQTKKARLLYTREEQSWLAKAQSTMNMDANALIKPDRDLLIVARCIENARIEYQTIKGRERFDKSFSKFLIPRINECDVIDWNIVIEYFDFSDIKSSQATVDAENLESIGVESLMEALQNYIAGYKKKYGVTPETLMLDSDVHMMFANAGVYRNAEKYFGNIQIVPLWSIEGGVIWKASPPKSRNKALEDLYDDDIPF